MFFPKYLNIAGFPDRNRGLVDTSKNPGIYGFEGQFLNCLAEALSFQFSVLLPHDGQWGSFENGSWTGIIGMIQRGEADMGVSYIAVTEERSKAVDFRFPYAVIERTFVVKEPGPIPHIAAYLYPFSKSVWSLYIFLIIAFTFLFKNIIFSNASFVVSFFAILSSVLNQSIKVHRLSDWKRLVLGLWMTIAATMPFLYTTSFLSFVTMPGRMPGIKDFQDLSKSVLNDGYKCLAARGTAEVDLLLKSKMDHLKILGKVIKRNNWKYELNEDFKNLIDDSTALIVSRQLPQMVLGNLVDTDVEISEDSFGTWNIAIAVGKGFCCKQQLDIQIIRILSGGLYKKWFDDEVFLKNLPRKLSRNYIERDISLSLDDLKSSLFILLIGLNLSLIIFLVEIFSVTQFYKRIFEL